MSATINDYIRRRAGKLPAPAASKGVQDAQPGQGVSDGSCHQPQSSVALVRAC